MDIKIYDFPVLKDKKEVEKKFCELYNKYREGIKLDPEVLDWMDSANSWLLTSND